jgi:hypothetical protein
MWRHKLSVYCSQVGDLLLAPAVKISLGCCFVACGGVPLFYCFHLTAPLHTLPHTAPHTSLHTSPHTAPHKELVLPLPLCYWL